MDPSRICTACTLDCPDTCSLLAVREGDRLTVRGNPAHPYTQGFVCGKIHSWLRRLWAPNRIREPLLRQGDRWQPISWTAALDLCAEHLQWTLQREATMVHLQGEAGRGVLHAACKRFFQSLGAISPAGSLCDSAGIVACETDFGSLEHNDIRELETARTIINWGKDLSRSSVHTAALVRRAKRNGAQVTTISPGGDGNRAFSDRYIRIAPDSDRFVAAAVLKRVLELDPSCRRRLEAASQGSAYRAWLEAMSWEALLGQTGCGPEELEHLARLYAGGPVVSLLGWGMQRYRHGGENVRAINALAYASGQIGIPGGGSYFNIGSMRHLPLDWLYPEAPAPRQPFCWSDVGRALSRMRPEYVWIAGSNVVNQAPESKRTAEALRRSGFTVVVDGFMTDTAQCADLVLPAALMLEQTEIVGSCLHDGVQLSRQVLPPPGQAHSDYAIIRALSERVRPDAPLPEEDVCLTTTLQHSPSLPAQAWNVMQRQGFVIGDHPRLAFAGGETAHFDGRFHCLPSCSPPIPCDPAYPLRLITAVRRDAVHSQIGQEEQGTPEVWLGPDSQVWKEIAPGQQARLVSPLGVLRVRCVPSSDLHPDAVLYRRGDWMSLGGGANQLIESLTTDLGGGTAYYEQRVRLEPLHDN